MKALVLAIGLAGIAAADDVRLTIHMVAMEPAKLAELMEGTKEPSIDKARAMVKAGEARLFDTMLLRMERGTQARLMSEGEVTYPSEYEAPDLPNSMEYEEKVRRRMDGWFKAYPFMPIQSVWTGEFEKRGVGEALDGRAEDDGTVRWNLDLTRHVGETVHLERQNLEGEEFKYRFPVFESLTLEGKTAPGGWICAGVLGIPGKDGSPGEKIVVFAKTTALVMEE